MQARDLLLVRPPVEERKTLPGAFMSVIADQSKFHRRTGIKHMHVFGSHRVHHPVGLVFRNGKDDLDGLIGEPEHVCGVMRPRMPRSLCTIDDRRTMNAQLLRFMKQPVRDGLVAVAAILFCIESELVAVHVCLLQTTPGCRHEVGSPGAQGPTTNSSA